jgi:hypothetical protein
MNPQISSCNASSFQERRRGVNAERHSEEVQRKTMAPLVLQRDVHERVAASWFLLASLESERQRVEIVDGSRSILSESFEQ